jgi:hypothetical protein
MAVALLFMNDLTFDSAMPRSSDERHRLWCLLSGIPMVQLSSGDRFRRRQSSTQLASMQ